LSVALAPLLLGILAAAMCVVSAGPTLGLFIGPLILITLLVPPLTMSETLSVNRLIVLAALLVPFCTAWFIFGVRADVHAGECLASSVVLIAYAIALAGLSVGLRLLRLPALACAALSVTVGLVWLTWPIWASRTWNGGDSEASVARIVVCHPGFVINGQVTQALGNWTEQSLAYHLTELAQSVNFAIPQSILTCVLLHGLFGGGILILAAWLEKRRPVTDTSDAPAHGAPVID
jgi:hypothetical protein